MGWLTRWVRRLGYLLNREAEERELLEEMRLHIDLEAAELVREGVEPAEAQRLAHVRFGGVERFREQTRGSRGVGWIDDLAKDLRVAVRGLRRSPGFAAGALLVIGLGIGATTTIFGVVQGVLLAPLPYPESDRLVRLWGAVPDRGSFQRSVSVPDYRDWRDGSGSFSHMAAYSTAISSAVLVDGGPAEEVQTVYVSGDFFGTYGTPALHGSVPDGQDELRDPWVVTLSHEFWKRRYGGDPSLVGRSIQLEGRPFRVGAVMPPGYSPPHPGVEVWLFMETVPQESAPHHERFVNIMQVVGRLAPATSLEAARAEVSGVARSLSEQYPGTNEGLTQVTVVPLKESIVGSVATSMWVVFGAVGFLLAIAIINVAGLLIARAGERRSEIALRQSLGAGRGRIVRQLLAETGVLALLGGLVGLGLAAVATEGFARLAIDLVPRASEVRLDAGIFGFALGLVAFTTVASGLFPAIRAAALDLAGELREGGARMLGAASTARSRRIVVGAQVAVAVVLLIGAGLMARSLQELRSVDPGFEPAGAAAMTLTLNTDVYPTAPEYLEFYHRILDELRAVPGVTSVGSMRRLPTRGAGESWGLAIPGVWEAGPTDDPSVEIIHVGGDVFAALGSEVVRGRAFEAADVDGPGVVVVNTAFEERYLAGLSALTTPIEVGGAPVEVIGVVENIRHDALDVPPEPSVYISIEQNPRIGMAIVARTSESPSALLGEMQARLTALESNQPISDLTLLEGAVEGATTQDQLLTMLFVAFAALATLLAATGVYGVVALTVRQRHRDMGLRMALGAHPGEVVRLVVRQGMIPAVVGVILGTLAAGALSRVMATLLFEVPPLDPTAFAAGSAVLVLFALAASFLPARQVARLDPMRALRDD